MRNITDWILVLLRPARIIIEGFDDEPIERAISAPRPSSLGPVMRTIWGVRLRLPMDGVWGKGKSTYLFFRQHAVKTS